MLSARPKNLDDGDTKIERKIEVAIVLQVSLLPMTEATVANPASYTDRYSWSSRIARLRLESTLSAILRPLARDAWVARVADGA
jgi:hypothetical protein